MSKGKEEKNAEVSLRGKSVNLKEWPMRPGFKHLETTKKLFAQFLDVAKSMDGADQFKVVDALLKVELEENQLTALVALCGDGSDMLTEDIEKLAVHDFIVLSVAVIGFNVHPMKGLSDQVRKLYARFTKRPQE